MHEARDRSLIDAHLRQAAVVTDTGSTQRGQTHALADDIAQLITRKPDIAQTKISFKVETRGGKSEI